MGKRKKQFMKLFGYVAVSEDGRAVLGTSQAGGDLGKVESSLPGSKVKDKNNQICTQPMSPAKRERILGWISKR